MTIRELDRLMSKTELTPLNKRVLRKVRKAVLSGNTTDPEIGSASWRIGVTDGEHGVTVSFSFKKD